MTLVGTMMKYHGAPKNFGTGPAVYTHYNNYIIFKQSYIHLTENKNLYQLYPDEHWDYFKYSPTFSYLFSIFACMPDEIGCLCWCLLNSVVLFISIRLLPLLDLKQKMIICWIVSIENLTAIQSQQSNSLVAGLILLAFGLLHRKQGFLAALCISITVYIKLFGAIAFCLFLFFPGKIKHSGYICFWMLLLLVLPLLMITPLQYMSLMESWKILLNQDYNSSVGLSLYGMLETWFDTHQSPTVRIFDMAGAVLVLLSPLWFLRHYTNNTRLCYIWLAALMTWLVLFNHKAESPSYIIALCGVALWYFNNRLLNKKYMLWLLYAVLALTCLSPGDLYPVYLREHVISPYKLKVLPCAIVWVLCIYELFKAWHQAIPHTGISKALQRFSRKQSINSM